MFLLLLFPLISLIIFNYIPMYGLIIVFKDYKLTKGIWGSEWVGLDNIIRMLSYPELLQALLNSFILNIYGFIAGFPVTILFALLLNEIRQTKLKRSIQTITYLPHFLSWVVTCALIAQVLSPNTGVVNDIIEMLGGKRIYFLIQPQYIRHILVWSGIWKGVGWGSIIYLAAISGTDPQLYDSATIDGAGRFKQALHITIPSMYPIITIGLIFSVSGLLGSGNFEQIYNLANSQTLSKVDVISTYLFRIGLQQFEYSRSAAIGLLNTLVAIFFLAIANKIASYFSEYTIW